MSENYDLVVRSAKVSTGEGIRPASVAVRDGVIRAITTIDAELQADRVVELEPGVVLLPGVVDTHVHVNEPGRTDWEGFASATRAAAAGGVTTLIDMPLNSIPPTTTPDALKLKRSAAAPQALVNVGFWGGAIPANLGTLRALHDAGVFGFKSFLSPSGVDEFPALSTDELFSAAVEIAEFEGLLIVHAEDPDVLDDVARARAGHNAESVDTARVTPGFDDAASGDEVGGDAASGDAASGDDVGTAEHGATHAHVRDDSVAHLGSAHGGRDYRDFVASRPEAAEQTAIAHVIDAVRRTGVRAHILHLSSASALAQLTDAKREGLPITVETCPHYLTFSSDAIRDGATQFKCCPPIRDEHNRELLWQALESGEIDLIASDHSPSTRELKLGFDGDFDRAWGGISGLQLSLSAVWTGAQARGIALEKVSEWMSEATARFAGLPTKGRIKVGADADMIAFDPNASFTVDVQSLAHKNPVSAFDGVTLFGRVRTTWLAGREVYTATDVSASGTTIGNDSPTWASNPTGALLVRTPDPCPTVPASESPSPSGSASQSSSPPGSGSASPQASALPASA